MRIVSLVPSLTETLFHFGLGDRLVARTDYCTEPEAWVSRIEAVGGTKNPNTERIIELRPDMVILNREENRREDAERLASAGLRLHVSHPTSVLEAVEMLEGLGDVLDCRQPAAELAARCRTALERLRAEGVGDRALPAFCPVWRRPWMTFADSTYVGDVLRTTGFANVFGAEAGGEAFFEVSLSEAVARSPGVVLLPDEPFHFLPRHASELQREGLRVPAVFVDGKSISWYGPRIPASLESLSALGGRFCGA